MQSLKFTKNEKEEIQKNMKLLLEDLRELADLSQRKQIRTSVSCWIENGRWDLIITDREIYLQDRYSHKIKHLHKKNILGEPKINVDPETGFYFIRSYEDIKEEVHYYVEQSIKEKGSGLEVLQKMNQKYDKKASIAIELPPANNQYPLEVTEENGQKIGRLKFGDRTIEIITNGDIVLVDKTTRGELGRVKSKKQKI